MSQEALMHWKGWIDYLTVFLFFETLKVQKAILLVIYSITFPRRMYLSLSLLPYKIKTCSCLMFSNILVCSWAALSAVSSVLLKVCLPTHTAQAYANSFKCGTLQATFEKMLLHIFLHLQESYACVIFKFYFLKK